MSNLVEVNLKYYIIGMLMIFLLLICIVNVFQLSICVGESMAPTLQNGHLSIFKREYLFIRNFTGEIILIKEPANWTGTYFDVNFIKGEIIIVCHRVILDNGTHVLMKGDNNTYSDGWFPRTNIIGRLIWY